MNFHCINMDCVGWLWLVVLCSQLIRASATNGMGRKVLTDLERVSPILLEMGCWETIVCMGYSFYIRHFGHIYGKIEEHWERKGY